MKNKQKNKYKFLLKNTFLFTLSNFANKLIVFFLLPFYTTYLSTEEYAIIDLANITQQLLFPILTLAITDAVVRFAMDKKENKKEVFTIGFLIVLSGCILMCFVSNIFINIPFLRSLWEIKSIFIVYYCSFAFCTLFSSYARATDRVNVMVISSIIGTLVTTILSVLFIAILKKSINGYLYASIIGCLIQIIIYISLGKIFLDLQFYSLNKEFVKRILLYAIPLIPNAISWWINSSLDRYLLTSMTSLTVVGLYAAANKIPSALSSLTSIFHQAWSLSVYEEYDDKNGNTFFQEIYLIYDCIMVLATTILLFSNKFLCSLLFNKDFFDAWNIVPWLLIGFYCNSLSTFLGTAFTAAKKTNFIFLTTGVGALINIIMNCLLIPNYGAIGSAIATYLSYLIVLIVRLIIVKHIFPVRFNLQSFVASQLLILFLCIFEILYINMITEFLGILVLLLLSFLHRNQIKSLLRVFSSIFYKIK